MSLHAPSARQLRRAVSVLLPILVLLVLAAPSRPAAAQPGFILVNTTADGLDHTGGSGDCETSPGNGECTLRAAIQTVNVRNAGGMTITGITIPQGFYTLTLAGNDNTAEAGDLDILAGVTINGAGANLTIIQAAASAGTSTDRVFDIRAGTVSITNLMIRHGNSTETGGGIRVASGATLNLTDVNVNDNRGLSGGGIHNAGTTHITTSAVFNNTATGSGGGVLSDGAHLSITNSTVSTNRATISGGGVHAGLGTAAITQATIANNVADTDNDTIGEGGGLSNAAASVSVVNTILGGNTRREAPQIPVAEDCAGPITSLGYNLFQAPAACTITGDTTGNILNLSPNLVPLGPQGNAQTRIHAISSTSPVNDGGKPSVCSATDQIGQSRVDANGDGLATCDIGAFENQSGSTSTGLNIKNIEDGGDGECSQFHCTLREAIIAANRISGTQTVSLSTHVYQLGVAGRNEDAAATGDLDITDSVILQGNGWGLSIIDGAQLDRVLDIHGAMTTVTLNGVTVRNGLTFTGDGGGGAIRNAGSLTLRNTNVEDSSVQGAAPGDAGGAVLNLGTLTVDESVIQDNSADHGGGIFNADGATLTITESTLARNAARFGGGIELSGTGALTNSTISANTATSNGGGILVDGSLELTNVTLALNSTISPGNANSLAADADSSVTLRDTIIASGEPGVDCALATAITSLSHNLGRDNSCGLSGANDQQGVDPLLGPLQTTIGPLPVHVPGFGSPAVDRGSAVGCPERDQRTIARPVDGDGDGTPACDIGAVEIQAGAAGLHGTVTLQGRSTASPGSGMAYGPGYSMATVTLDPGGPQERTVPVDEDGDWRMGFVPTGTYTVEASAPGFLTAHRMSVVVSTMPVALPSVHLAAGRVTPDAMVTITDITTLIAAFGRRTTDRTDDAGNIVDLNGDGVVNLHDITLALGNFGKSGEQPW